LTLGTASQRIILPRKKGDEKEHKRVWRIRGVKRARKGQGRGPGGGEERILKRDDREVLGEGKERGRGRSG
jgi:hypothetical protein